MDIDLNTVRIAVTLVSLLLFVALMVHSWSRRRQPEHAAAAQLPFMGEEQRASATTTHVRAGEQK